MMPQKKNPDVAEVVRGKTGRVVGDLVALLVTLKGLPLGYNRDLQEDKVPVFDAVHAVRTSLDVLADAISALSLQARPHARGAGRGLRHRHRGGRLARRARRALSPRPRGRRAARGQGPREGRRPRRACRSACTEKSTRRSTKGSFRCSSPSARSSVETSWGRRRRRGSRPRRRTRSTAFLRVKRQPDPRSVRRSSATLPFNLHRRGTTSAPPVSLREPTP
jgi:hypothetical protein